MIVDGDVLVYKIVSACQEKFQWEQDEVTNYIDLRRAKQSADGMLSEWRVRLKCGDIFMAFSDHTKNWRKALLPSYKAHRAKEKPMGYYELEEYLLDTYDGVQIHALEGDDVAAMQGTQLGSKKCVIVTIDKDLNGVPVPLWNPTFPKDDPKDISEAEADYFHLLQTLMGDKVDNYDGCPSIGPVKAQKILEPFFNKKRTRFDVRAAWAGVLAAYKKEGKSEEEALVQARVARILRNTDFNYGTNQPILWRPQ